MNSLTAMGTTIFEDDSHEVLMPRAEVIRTELQDLALLTAVLPAMFAVAAALCAVLP